MPPIPTRQRLAISTVSLGWHETHTLPRKLLAVSKAGYTGVEIFYSDLSKYAQGAGISTVSAAAQVRSMCKELALEVVSIASLDNFEGMEAEQPLELRLRAAEEWVELAKELATEDKVIVQVPSSYASKARELFQSGKDKAQATIVREFQALADLAGRDGGKSPRVIFAYEFMPWSVVDCWQDCLRVARAVGRSNFGLCIDTYHFISGVWGDCCSEDGRAADADTALRASLAAFVREIKKEDVVYVQLSDAEYLSPPLGPDHEAWNEAKHPKEMWCSYGRLFPLEQDRGAYFPMEVVCNAWLKQLGWDGWVSMETFHREMREPSCGPEHLADRGIRSWKKLERQLSLE